MSTTSGYSWHHEVVVESIEPACPLILKFAVCVDGQRACPPEDCGGTGGYGNLPRGHRLIPIMKSMTDYVGVDPSLLRSRVL